MAPHQTIRREEVLTRKVPAIVLDRPPFARVRLLWGLLIGLLGGVLLGGLTALLLGARHATDLPPGPTERFLPPYVTPYVLAGLVLGALIGVAWGRSTSPRVAEVEVPVQRSLRRSAGTGLIRR